jgi:hypothetical protein
MKLMFISLYVRINFMNTVRILLSTVNIELIFVATDVHCFPIAFIFKGSI